MDEYERLTRRAIGSLVGSLQPQVLPLLVKQADQFYTYGAENRGSICLIRDPNCACIWAQESSEWCQLPCLWLPSQAVILDDVEHITPNDENGRRADFGKNGILE